MKIFLDTADTDVIEKYFSTGLVDGVTTNPTLIMKSGKNPENVYQTIKDMGVQDISMEVVGSDLEMYDEGKRLYEKFGDVCTVKVPCTREGLIVCKRLSEQGIKVNVTLIFCAAQAVLAAQKINVTLTLIPCSESHGTLIFCAAQAVLAAKAGATYVSPFVGRLDDQSVAGLEVVRSISELYRIHGIKTQVLAASIRSVQRAIRSWYNGAEICTMPPKVFDQMYDHILTDKGLEIFDKDWKEVQK